MRMRYLWFWQHVKFKTVLDFTQYDTGIIRIFTQIRLNMANYSPKKIQEIPHLKIQFLESWQIYQSQILIVLMNDRWISGHHLSDILYPSHYGPQDAMDKKQWFPAYLTKYHFIKEFLWIITKLSFQTHYACP